MEKIYNPKNIEEPIYEFWDKSNYFEPYKVKNYKENYCIIMPPPNITGNLHLGHAFQQTIMDILIRYHKMQGKNTLWNVGFDHAGIATQILVENDIYNKTNQTRNNYTRNFLLKQIWGWKKEAEKSIIYQMKRLGFSISWKNKRFTMDPKSSFAVKEAFIRLYQDNLIYRGKRLVNWDSKLQTAISDLEVSHKQIKGYIWYIRYQLEDSSPHIYENNSYKNNKYLVIATTRPETMLGDVAVAINPKDTRYNQLIGRYVLIPIINRRIPIIADEYIDSNKGTGCVKITPGHDFNDYIIAKKHKLIMINILSCNNKILQKPEIFNSQGQPYCNHQAYYFIPKIFHNLCYNKAREIIISECSKLNLLESSKIHDLIIPYNNRTNTIIEPMLTNQWYIRTKNLADQAIYAVKKDIIEFIPKQYKKMYFEWMNNIQDWCISRQIWWGHEIPAWYDNNNNIYVGYSEKDIRIKNELNNNITLHKDNDVLDTWFSSSLWTFSSLGWPNNEDLLKAFHPTDIVISGFDIIFFWIARMIMMTMYFMKDKNTQIPFKRVYITGLIRDEFGKKMSKSKGNVLDPLDIVDGITINDLLKKRLKETEQSQSHSKYITKYTTKQFPNGIKAHGADSLRLTLTALSSSGRDIHWDANRLTGYHNFCNKLWNVSRFVLIHTINQDCGIQHKKIFSLADKWIITKLNQTIQNYHESLQNYRFDKAVNIIYEFIWHQFCDWYIEFTKPILYNNNNILKLCGTRYTLITCLETLLRLAHPIIPFITEKIWQEVKHVIGIDKKSIMLQSFPKYDSTNIDHNSILNLEIIKNIISEVRIIRNYTGIAHNVLLKATFNQVSDNIKQCILENYKILTKIANLENISFLKFQKSDIKKSISIILNKSELLILIPNTFDKDAAINRFLKKIKLIDQKIFFIQKKIDNTLYQKQKNNFTKAQEKLIYYNQIKKKLLNQCSIIEKL